MRGQAWRPSERLAGPPFLSDWWLSAMHLWPRARRASPAAMVATAQSVFVVGDPSPLRPTCFARYNNLTRVADGG